MLTLDRLREVNVTTDGVTETGTEVVIVEDHDHQAIGAQGHLVVKAR
jgi:hypothetical protein